MNPLVKIVLGLMVVFLAVAQLVKSQPIKILFYVLFVICAIISFIVSSKSGKR